MAWTDNVSDHGQTSTDPVGPAPAQGWQPLAASKPPHSRNTTAGRQPGRWAGMSRINKAGVIIIGGFVALVALVAALADPEPEVASKVSLTESSTTEVVLPYAETTHRPEVTNAPTTSSPPATAARIAPVAAAPPTTAAESYPNCTEMRKVHPNGVQRDHPAYEQKHDRDNDGHACEP